MEAPDIEAPRLTQREFAFPAGPEPEGRGGFVLGEGIDLQVEVSSSLDLKAQVWCRMSGGGGASRGSGSRFAPWAAARSVGSND